MRLPGREESKWKQTVGRGYALRPWAQPDGRRQIQPRGFAPLPVQAVTEASASTSFASKDVPLVDDNVRAGLDKVYRTGRKPKALALSPQGMAHFFLAQANVAEAMRRSLEACGSRAGAYLNVSSRRGDGMEYHQLMGEVALVQEREGRM